MSKAMRVVDREIIERQVVNAWKDKSLSELKQLIEETGFGKECNDLLSEFNSLVDQISELEKERNSLKERIESMTKDFNTKNCNIDDHSYRYHYEGTYVDLNLGHYSNSKSSGYELKTNVPSDIRTGISDELGLQTMGGDFNAKELVEALIAKFVG